jgi:hypothetical protein
MQCAKDIFVVDPKDIPRQQLSMSLSGLWIFVESQQWFPFSRQASQARLMLCAS